MESEIAHKNSKRDWDGVKYAGLGPRLAAWVLDLLILSFSIFFLFGGILLSGGTLAGPDGGTRSEVAFLYFALVIFYPVGFWSWKQATPGKILKGLRVVDAKTGASAGIVRYLIRFVSFVILGAVIWLTLNPRKQGLHDLIAGTVVVKKNSL